MSEDPFEGLHRVEVTTGDYSETGKTESTSVLKGLQGPVIEKIGKDFTEEELTRIDVAILNMGGLEFHNVQFLKAEAVDELVLKLREWVSVPQDESTTDKRRAIARNITDYIKANYE